MSPSESRDLHVKPPKFGVAISNFNYEIIKPNHLSLYVGDTVVIVDEVDEWYFGYKSKGSCRTGSLSEMFCCLEEIYIHEIRIKRNCGPGRANDISGSGQCVERMGTNRKSALYI
ncbi:hypothetical protein HDE_06388 [Halotydeus destructor]|nr:hypothetical protein HDE_06388 [Halotydeus destructor]